jgi:secondary thiamine-phosphate synthase enzyme
MIKNIQLTPHHQGLVEITAKVNAIIQESDIEEGLCSLFIKHTSCSLTIQENADPSAQHDLENWMNRLVKEGDPLYTHTFEGVDDMPAHIKAALTATTLSIPFQERRLCLGTWQGIFLWEHRHQPSARTLVVHLGQ